MVDLMDMKKISTKEGSEKAFKAALLPLMAAGVIS